MYEIVSFPKGNDLNNVRLYKSIKWKA